MSGNEEEMDVGGTKRELGRKGGGWESVADYQTCGGPSGDFSEHVAMLIFITSAITEDSHYRQVVMNHQPKKSYCTINSAFKFY